MNTARRDTADMADGRTSKLQCSRVEEKCNILAVIHLIFRAVERNQVPFAGKTEVSGEGQLLVRLRRGREFRLRKNLLSTVQCISL